MVLTGKFTDKILSVMFYASIMLFTVWAGLYLVDYSLDTRFYKEFLLKWEVTARGWRTEKNIWPLFEDDRHLEYMDELVGVMIGAGYSPPASNTSRPYIYRVKKTVGPVHLAFLLCFPDQIILYGLPEQTFNRLDRFIDGRQDSNNGLFTGYADKAHNTFIGLLSL